MLTVKIEYEFNDDTIEIVRTEHLVPTYGSAGPPKAAEVADELTRQALSAFKGAVNA